MLNSLIKRISNNPKKQIFIDIGANTWSSPQDQMFIDAAKKGAKVFAFEPNPFAYKKLLETTSQFKNVQVFNKAVLDKPDKLKLYLHEKSDEDEVLWSSGSSLLDFKGNVNKEKYVEVEVVDIAEFVKSLKGNIKVVKIDVEGVEHKIINRLIDTKLISKIDSVLAETHEKKIPEIAKDIEKLKKRIESENIKNINLDWI